MTILIDKTCNGLLEHGYSCMYLYHIYIYQLSIITINSHIRC